MTLSIGTIESYVPGSTEYDQTQYADLGTQGRDSISLSDSNLWLVDSTSMDQLSTDGISLLTVDSTSLTTDGQGYLAPMSDTTMQSTTGDITVYGSDPNTDSILYTSDPTLQLSDGAPLLEVQGSTQSGTSLLSGSGGTSTTTDGGTLTSSDPAISGAGSTGSVALTGSGDSTNSGSVQGVSDVADSGSVLGVNDLAGGDIGTSGDIQDAPFELHSAVGLLVIGAIVIGRRWDWRRPGKSVVMD
jgi:hypothetical protein